ncbi:FAD-dependent oxidoreductase [cf. Phormidesmis sp. LEGE 11477]|uniref:FAD-dependent oxidoreductase n=1 Tax=cf. Phormidesmis sp. LEGE 11477 TaxID=1828680 RepID=UPI00187E1D1F|nr:FAD-dependent oxidoreductase [cf. Phormidesmis sp. LEGE 11477]MBE9060723.1 FAD-dependent oxidoreductase [cf. Phormidesmis sp. LEGE 11477]
MGVQQVSVCQVGDLKIGEMRQFSIAGKEILLAKTEHGISAIAPHCSHYGAPLAEGVMHNGRIVCPWHNACFSADTGTHLSAPGRDNLAKFPVHIESDTVYVELPEEITEHVTPELIAADFEIDRRTFVIVGGGAASDMAAQTLRQNDYQGKIIVLTAEEEIPYDRTKLSKAYLQADEVGEVSKLRSADFYKQHDIEIRTSAKVTGLDVEAKQITYGAGETLSYDALLLATGGAVKQVPVEGSELDNVFTLRRAEDAKAILKAAKQSKKAVIIGSGFIGMETAASLKQQGLEVTVVSPDQVPFEKVLGEPVGKLFRQVHDDNDVKFKLGEKATALRGNGKVETVELESGEVLSADMVVVGIGVKPATDFVEGLLMNEKDGSILVNQYLQAKPDVYAAGDIARFPHFITGQPTRIEHWQLAMQQGRIAACNMTGQQVMFETVPFFWTGQFDLKLRYVGHSENYDDIVIQGSLEDKSFLAFYVEGEQAMAVSGIGRDRDIAAISELMRLRKMPKAKEIKSKDIDWVEKLKAV